MLQQRHGIAEWIKTNKQTNKQTKIHIYVLSTSDPFQT